MDTSSNENVQYNVCIKCKHTEFHQGEMRATGGFWTKLFNIQNLKFKTLSCKNCGYTEMYKKNSSKSGNILDFFFG